MKTYCRSTYFRVCVCAGGGGVWCSFGCLVVPNGSFLNVFYALNYGARLTSIYQYIPSLKPSTFPFFSVHLPCNYSTLTVRSPWAHNAFTVPSLVFSTLLFALIVQKALTVHPQSVHLALTLRSAFINQLILYLGWYVVNFFYFYLVTDKTQCKDNLRGILNESFILLSHSNHILFDVCSLFALCSAFAQSFFFISACQIPFRVRSECAHHLLSVHSPFTQCSSGKVESFRDSNNEKSRWQRQIPSCKCW